MLKDNAKDVDGRYDYQAEQIYETYRFQRIAKTAMVIKAKPYNQQIDWSVYHVKSHDIQKNRQKSRFISNKLHDDNNKN